MMRQMIILVLASVGISTLTSSHDDAHIITCLTHTKWLAVQAMAYIGKLQIETRKIDSLAQYFRPPWTNIDHNRFDYELCAIRRGASNDRFQAETFRILNEKYEHYSKIYTDES
jgi:hypothetical protein